MIPQTTINALVAAIHFSTERDTIVFADDKLKRAEIRLVFKDKHKAFLFDLMEHLQSREVTDEIYCIIDKNFQSQSTVRAVIYLPEETVIMLATFIELAITFA